MNYYKIESKASCEMGVYKGNNKAEALLSCLRNAGYQENQVWFNEGGDDLQHADDDYVQMCGFVKDWIFDKLEVIDWNGKEIILLQSPYLESDCNGSFYYSNAQDEEGNEYEVRWEIKDDIEFDEDGFSQCEPEHMCDWSKFKVKKI